MKLTLLAMLCAMPWQSASFLCTLDVGVSIALNLFFFISLPQRSISMRSHFKLISLKRKWNMVNKQRDKRQFKFSALTAALLPTLSAHILPLNKIEIKMLKCWYGISFKERRLHGSSQFLNNMLTAILCVGIWSIFTCIFANWLFIRFELSVDRSIDRSVGRSVARWNDRCDVLNSPV